MFMLGIIILVIALVGLFLVINRALNDNNFSACFGFLLFTIIALFGCGILSGKVIYKDDGPTAMEVYQGKTTLEITYRDGIPVDSVVVFKEK